MDQGFWLRILLLLSVNLMVQSDIRDDEEILDSDSDCSPGNLKELIHEAYAEEKTLALASRLVNSEPFRKILNRNFGGKLELITFYNDEKAYKKFQAYMYTYCRGSQMLKIEPNLIKAIRSFIKFWPKRDISKSTYDLKNQELGVEPGFVGYLYKFIFYLQDLKGNSEYSYINDEFIHRVAATKYLIVILSSRMEVAKQSTFDFNAERRFYEELFDAVDEGVFNEQLDAFAKWRNEVLTKNEEISTKYTQYIENQQKQFKFNI